MIGAVIGDVVGSKYEFDNIKTKDFEFLASDCYFTDDTVLTMAVCEVLLEVSKDMTDDEIRSMMTRSIRKWGRKYPDESYGIRFGRWLMADDEKPYGSFGNGSAMRVSSAGWLFDDMETTRRMARLSAEVTHSHPLGVKGAEAVAAAVFMARNGASKKDIWFYMEDEFDYDVHFCCDEIRETYSFDETCEGTVPEALAAFFDGTDFEDSIRNGVSLGGDTDTLCAITGTISEAYYGVPADYEAEVRYYLTDEMNSLYERFKAVKRERKSCGQEE